MENKCEAGCKVYSCGTIKHISDCKNYSDSFSELFDQVQKENEELKSLLKNVQCPDCNNDGVVAYNTTNYDLDTGVEYEQCQWCTIKDQLIPPIKKEENTSLDEYLPF
jgi:hypothetical protein